MNNINQQTTRLPWWTCTALAVVATLFTFFFSTTASPYYKDCFYWSSGDSGIYQEMGLCLQQGGVPYIDLFDHKGPLLFFIQAAGYALNPSWGLALLQSVSLFIALLFCHKTALLLTPKAWQPFAVDLLFLFTTLCFYDRGNMCEEWSLPLLWIPIYIYIKSFCTRQTIHTAGAFIIGICCGAIAMIKSNNAAPTAGFLLCYFVSLIRQKQWRVIINNCIFILLGIATMMLPCCLFFYLKAGTEGVGQMFFGTFIFNFRYIADVDPTFHNISRITKYYLPEVCFIVITILSIHSPYRRLAYACLVVYTVTLFAIGFNLFIRYLIIFTPLYAISLCLFFHSLDTIKSKPRSRISRVVNRRNCSYALLLVAGFTGLKTDFDGIYLPMLRTIGKAPINTYIFHDFRRFLNTIPSEQRSDIYNVYALPQYRFVEQHIVQRNRFVFPRHVALAPEFALYEQQHGIREKQPHWIFIAPNTNYLDEPTLLYVKEHYTLADSICNHDSPVAYCYRRNP